MKKEKFDFKIPGHENEEIIIFGRRHWLTLAAAFGMILTVFILITFCLVIFSSVARLGNFFRLLSIIISIISFLLTTFAFYEFLKFYYTVLVVTPKSLLKVDQLGLINRKITEISLVNISNLKASVRGLFGTFFRFGNFEIQTGGQIPMKFNFSLLDNPILVASEILRIHNQNVEIQKKGKKLEVHGEIKDPRLVTEFSALEESIIEQPPPKPSLETVEKERQLAGPSKEPPEKIPPPGVFKDNENGEKDAKAKAGDDRS